MSLISLTFAFPHPVLMPIIGRPTNESVLRLKQEIYANAKSVHSLLGGVVQGHLALVLPAAAYIARPGTAAFIPPVHPGAPPEHAATSSQFVIAEGNRRYQTVITSFALYMLVKEHLRSQLL
jgi:hypothetical protein